jgi:hypothetical protein
VIKKVSIILLQLLVTAAGIFYVFHDPKERTLIAQALRHSDWKWLLLGWLCYGMVEALATVRWQILLRIQGIHLNWLRVGATVMIGLFFNMFLPGLVGGDVMRLYFVFKDAPRQRNRATLSVAMDRLLGLLSIVFLAALVVLFRFGWLKRFPVTTHIAYLALGLLGAAVVLIALLFGAVAFGLLKKLPKRFPSRKTILQSGKALDLYRTHSRPVLLAFILTVVAHLAYYMTFYCAAQSLHGSTNRTPSVSDVLSIMPLVNTITGVPISFGGVGVRETLFQQLLGNLAHVPAALAAITATLGFVIQASWGLVGGIAFIVSRRAKRA